MSKAVTLRRVRSRPTHRRRPAASKAVRNVPASATTAAAAPELNRNASPAELPSLWNQPPDKTAAAASHPNQPSAMLYLRPLKRIGPILQLQAFDAGYLEALRAGDPQTEEHFVCYFTELLQLKLRSRLRSPQAIEDVRQETFFRVLRAVRNPDGLRQPERLGPYVNTVCNNVMLEYWRNLTRTDSLDDEGAPEPHARGASVHDAVESRQMEDLVREVLHGLPEHDRSILKAVFIDERDREDICKEFGVERGYFRVLVHRAKHVFKAAYLKKTKDRPPFTSPEDDE